MLSITQISGFGGGVGGTPPTITSGSSTSVAEETPLSFAIITDMATTLSISGADSGDVELVSNTLATSHTLRWASNGTKDFESPSDADTDNVYAITITPVNSLGETGTPQSFTITVTDSLDWTNSADFTLSIDSGTDYNGHTLRQMLPASVLNVSGSNVRLVLQAGVSGSASISAIYIGEKAAAGDAYDMKASAPAPTQILYGGSGSFVIPANGSITTDALAFAIDETKDYVVSAQFNATTTLRAANGTGCTFYRKSGTLEAATADASSGYDTLSGSSAMVKTVQVAS